MDSDAIGCLIGAVFILAIGAFYVYIVGIAFLAILGVMSISIGLWTTGNVIWGYAGGLRRLALSGTWPVAADEPARVGFFFGPGFGDVKKLRSDSLTRVSTITISFDDAVKAPWSWWTGPFVKAFGFGGYIGWSIGSVLGMIITVGVHGAILAVCAAVAGVTAAVTAGLQLIWAGIWNIRHPCPSCYHKATPIFICPHCGAEHAQLKPGRYGVFFHTCECGTNLPTVGILGRRHLPARCRSCATLLSETETTDVHLAFAGGPSSGKSSLMYAAIAKLVESGREVTFADTSQESLIRAELQRLKSGSLVMKTAESLPKALHLLFKDRGPVDKSLYIYDVAGESFLSSDDPMHQTYYDHVDGVVFIIDPLSIEDFVDDMKDHIPASDLTSASSVDPQDAYGRLVQALYQHLGGKTKSIRRTRLAVAVSKADLPGVGNAIQQLDVAGNGGSSAAVRSWLESVGLSNLVHLMERDFGQVKYYQVSALGRSSSGESSGGYVGRGVMSPIKWALPVLKLDEVGNDG